MKRLALGLSLLLGTVSGVEAFNANDVERLKQTKACSGCDLSGAYLGWTDLRGAEMSNANLGGANVSNARLVGARMARAQSWVALISVEPICPAPI